MQLEKIVKDYCAGKNDLLIDTYDNNKVVRLEEAGVYNKVVVLDQWNYGIRVCSVYEIKDDIVADKDQVTHFNNSRSEIWPNTKD